MRDTYGTFEHRQWLHQHHWATTAALDPLGAGNTQLISDLGGNSAVLAFYDVRKNVTATTTVSAWDDVRGSSGFGPTLAQGTGANQPTWDAANLLITTDGSATWLASNAVALFANGSVGLTMVYVGTVPSAAGVLAYAATCIDASGYTAGVGVATQTTNVICARFRGGNAYSTVASSTTRRLVFAAKESTSAGDIEVPTNAQVRAFGTAASANNCQITVGGLFPGVGTVANGLPVAVRAILMLAGLYTTAQRDTLKTWATTYHSAVLV